ncbi:hypothetical protein [Rhizobium sp. CNPSo 4039]|uniref:hypothetical protein n=1 Tax=Rhizobium sp. CNPSo 4039 TaxID=3021409 RepID=UPI00119AD5E6|nr:hypothetical protein [Rhizobium sp. CNPSo 4039]MDK4715883.1 hypothetical protein [Rhizobium sp. CNPSo 4039]
MKETPKGSESLPPLLDGSRTNKSDFEWIEYFNRTVDDARLFCNLTRDSELQEECISRLREMRRECAEVKKNALDQVNEDFANILLGFECVVDSLRHELRMWIALKEGQPDAAWDRLISAQEAGRAAVRAHQGFSALTEHVERLDCIEKVVFPPQVFVSTGFIVGSQECSICGTEYGDCDHLEGIPYNGEFCLVLPKRTAIDHVAIVDDPRDRRCRITTVPTDQGSRNRMTWKLESSASGSTGSMAATGRILIASSTGSGDDI